MFKMYGYTDPVYDDREYLGQASSLDHAYEIADAVWCDKYYMITVYTPTPQGDLINEVIRMRKDPA